MHKDRTIYYLFSHFTDAGKNSRVAPRMCVYSGDMAGPANQTIASETVKQSQQKTPPTMSYVNSQAVPGKSQLFSPRTKRWLYVGITPIPHPPCSALVPWKRLNAIFMRMR